MSNINKMYSDFDPSLCMGWNKDVMKVTGVRSVKNSLLRIVTTRKGTRPFDPHFGCDLNKALFENLNPLTIDTIGKAISESIRNYEKRVKRLTVEVLPMYDSNEVLVTVNFSIITNPDELEQLKIMLSE